MSTIVTMTLDEVKHTQLTAEEKHIIRNAKAIPTDDCPAQTKEELAAFRPLREVKPELYAAFHPDFYKPKEAEFHIPLPITN